MRYRLTFIAGAAVGYVLGARAGRDRYEQLRKTAQRIAQNPAVRNTVESAGQQSRELAGKAADAVASRIDGRLPASMGERLRSLREQRMSDEDDWGTSNT
ncbi:YtxH domain-containing protein [Streptantibioticus ferralitis]|uniref:YtxH domain-containing protein n=1 Tax=Streptantibioticus ferralitis TaxID=236510 RepID=A0ABT5Z2H1_9ACTN|nr:YtxH domain-containing protein [Streptantibioticus ferralitis]MDF2258020.1 YtxH domain-containing protein [Streptantibioticus ferralitis]